MQGRPIALGPASERPVGTHTLGHQGSSTMELVDLRYLSVVVESGSLSNAAQSLGIKPSTISRRIIRLEDELGVTIFERGSFGYRLTTAGRDLMVRIRHVL